MNLQLELNVLQRALATLDEAEAAADKAAGDMRKHLLREVDFQRLVVVEVARGVVAERARKKAPA